MSSKKPTNPKEVYLILWTEGIITLRTDKTQTINKAGKISRYAYIQIESVRKDSSKAGSFVFTLNFYNKDLDKKKVKHVQFTCVEPEKESQVRKCVSWLQVCGMNG